MRRKILFVITKSNWGGAQRYVFDLATALAASHDIVVALGGNGPLAEMLQAQRIRTISLSSLKRDVSYKSEIEAFKELYRVILKEKPDVLHLNSSKAGGLGAFAGRLARVPHIVFTAHAWAWNEDRGLPARIAIAITHWLTVILAHTTITVSNAVYDQMAHFPFTRRRMRIIHLGITPPPLLSREQARAHLIEHCPALAHKNGPWCITLGELHPIKGHTFALTAFAEFLKAHREATYLMIGDGEMRESLIGKTRELGLTNSVFFLGHISNAATLLPAADIFILPSLSEAFGYVLLEAGAAHIPIVASRVGGIPEVVDDDSGILVPPRTPHALFAALSQTAGSPRETKARVATMYERVQSLFTKERMVAETAEVYERR